MVLAVPPRQVAGAAGALPTRRRRGDRPRPVRADRPAAPALSRRAGRRPVDALPARRPAAGRPRGNVDAAARPCRSTRPSQQDFNDRPARHPRVTGTSAARNGSSASTITRCRAAASSSRWSASHDDGPGDAAVVLPVLGSPRGLAVGCGMNPRYGDLDPYAMAACAIDEAVRNCVAVGADPARIAILDNFCWGNTDRPETLGSLVRAARGLPRRGPRLRHAVHQRQGQPQQRIHTRRPEPRHPADAADQRDRPRPRRPRRASRWT